MKTLYLVPLTPAQVLAAPPRGAWHATACPGDPSQALVVVEFWKDDQAADDWEAVPGVQPLHLETWGQPVPPRAVTLFGPWGVLPNDTIRQAMRKIRAQWSHARL